MEHREAVNRHRDELKALAILWVVYFHSPGCSSCARVQTALEQVYPEFESDIMLLDVDVTNRSERSFVETSGVITTPTLLFISPDGRENLFVDASRQNDIVGIDGEGEGHKVSGHEVDPFGGVFFARALVAVGARLGEKPNALGN